MLTRLTTSSFPITPVPTLVKIISWVISIPICALLLFSAYSKLNMSADTSRGFAHLGIPESIAFPLGITEALITILYLIPRTAIIGAILLTGYMGGAILTHLRIGEPIIVQALLAILLWFALYLRDAHLRLILSVRSSH